MKVKPDSGAHCKLPRFRCRASGRYSGEGRLSCELERSLRAETLPALPVWILRV